MKNVLVFRTSIGNRQDIKVLQPHLNQLIHRSGTWNFDLEDCDNILRVETQSIPPQSIQEIVQKEGFLCEELN